jgi:hypothetical protein
VSSSTREAALKEDFDHAVQRFRGFLTDQGFSSNVVWIEPSDVILTGGKRIFLYHSGGESASVAARKVFEQGVDSGNGVVLKGLFTKRDATYSFVWFPYDRSEAERAMVPPGVKLEVSVSLPQNFKVILIRSRERWEELSKRHSSIQFMKLDLFR